MPIGVLYLIDSLDAGGAERVALNLANNLPRTRYHPFLCATRKEGSLVGLIRPDVGYIYLQRRFMFDLAAILRLVNFVKQNQISILHAHSSSLLTAVLVKIFIPDACILWHDHFGGRSAKGSLEWIYRLLAKKVNGIITVNQILAEWDQQALNFPPTRVWYVPNFVESLPSTAQSPQIPGISGHRIVCVANFRKEKDHITLLKAMELIIQEDPQACLILVGSAVDQDYTRQVFDQIDRLHLSQKVFWLGFQENLAPILSQCDVGVLSSQTEGFPLVLLEYSSACLGVTATSVGQCVEILDHGNAGILVPPGSPSALAAALLVLLHKPHLRLDLGQKLQQRVAKEYSPEAIMNRLTSIYDLVIQSSDPTAS
jgi:glycosyltransferase involved in cell wall biosynthesis